MFCDFSGVIRRVYISAGDKTMQQATHRRSRQYNDAAEAEVKYGFKVLQEVSINYETFDVSYITDED